MQRTGIPRSSSRKLFAWNNKYRSIELNGSGIFYNNINSAVCVKKKKKKLSMHSMFLKVSGQLIIVLYRNIIGLYLNN